MENLNNYKNIKNFKNIFKYITRLSNFNRKFILIIFDIFLLNLSFKFVNYFFPGTFYFRNYFLLSIIFIPFFIITGQYNSLARFIGSKSIYSLFIRNSVILILYLLVNKINSLKEVILLWFFISFLLLNKNSFEDFYIFLKSRTERNFSNIVIYGAGMQAYS